MPTNPSRRAKRGRKGKTRARASCPVVKKVRRDKLGPWIQREGKLGGPGYTAKAERTRHHLLGCSLERFGYRSTLGSLQVLLRNRSMSKKARAAVKKDLAWLKEHSS